MLPVLCLVTDGRRFGRDWEDELVLRVGAAARAGVQLVQVRERDLDGSALVRLVERCVDAVRGCRTRVLVNDRLDVALAAGAHGVHLRGDSMPASRVRTVAPRGFLVGRSVRTPVEARRVAEEGGLDFLLVGTLYETPSKPGQIPAGVALLAEVVAATTLPVLAIGGISPARMAEVAATGAAGAAAIGMFGGGPVGRLSEIVNACVSAFEDGQRLPADQEQVELSSWVPAPSSADCS